MFSIDAITTHAAIARAISDQGTDYLLAVRNNQPILQAEVAAACAESAAPGNAVETDVAHDKGHGRIEERRKRRPRPIDFALARCRDGMKRRAVGSSSGTTRRGSYESLSCWTYAHGIKSSMSRARWPLAASEICCELGGLTARANPSFLGRGLTSQSADEQRLALPCSKTEKGGRVL